jgi:hypothetical protein
VEAAEGATMSREENCIKLFIKQFEVVEAEVKSMRAIISEYQIQRHFRIQNKKAQEEQSK